MSLLAYLFQVTLGLAIFYTFYNVALRKETLFQTNRVYLIATLLVSILLPLIRIYVLQLQHEDSDVSPSIIYVGSYLDTISITASSENKTISWESILLMAYIAGNFMLLLRMIREIMLIFKIKNKGQLIVSAQHRFILSAEVKAPFSFFRTMYLPADHQFGESELAEIMAHENAHIYEGHTVDVLLMEFACIFLWPSPMIYLYRKRLREVHEFLADAAVLKDTPWENYASFLIAQKTNTLQSRLTNQLIYSQLKNRLKMMTQQRSGFFARFKYLGLIPILLVSLVIFSFRERPIGKSNSIPSEKTGYNLYKDGLPVYAVWDSLILMVTKDKKYFLNSIEIPFSKLEQSLNAGTHGGQNRRVYLNIDKTLTVGTLADLMQIMEKLNLTMVLGAPLGHACNSGIDSSSWASVVVKSGNTILKENEDYLIDPTTGKLKILNEAYLDPEKPINVSFHGDTLPATIISAYKLPAQNPDSDLTKNDIEPYSFVEEMPHFPGENSIEAMYKFISNTIKYPSVPNQNIEGTAIVQFVVEPDGSLSRIKVVRSPNQYITDEVMRMMNVMAARPDKWVPGRHNGIAVPVSFSLPVKFVMPTSSKEEEVTSDTAEEQIFQYVEEMPRFPGCEEMEQDKRSSCASETMFKYIYESIKYPAEDRQNGNEGMVIAKFVVDPDGSVSNVRAVRSPGPGFSAEIIRVINGMNDLPQKWIPGRHEGKAVPVELILPFKFVLQQDHNPVIKNDEHFDEKSNSKADSEQSPVSLFSMVPNPADDFIKVEFSKDVINALVLNNLGSNLGVVWQKKFNEKVDFTQSIDISKWVPGEYKIQAYSKTQMSLKSFIVQH
ncbi:MAG: TonB family protein [Saprospiraceae bacterium]